MTTWLIEGFFFIHFFILTLLTAAARLLYSDTPSFASTYSNVRVPIIKILVLLSLRRILLVVVVVIVVVVCCFPHTNLSIQIPQTPKPERNSSVVIILLLPHHPLLLSYYCICFPPSSTTSSRKVFPFPFLSSFPSQPLTFWLLVRSHLLCSAFYCRIVGFLHQRAE